MPIQHFPLHGLRLTTPRLQLRLPTDEELGALADLAVEGVHEPDRMPFQVPWTKQPPAEVGRSVVQHHWRTLGEWRPQHWELPLAVFVEGTVVGVQEFGAHQYAITRQVSSGSWLGRRFQGRGIGTEMRAAMLHLAFVGLDAQEAVSAAFLDNPASLAVSRKLGYLLDGLNRNVVDGVLAVEQRFRLPRADWQPTVEVRIDGLDDCRPLFGR